MNPRTISGTFCFPLRCPDDGANGASTGGAPPIQSDSMPNTPGAEQTGDSGTLWGVPPVDNEFASGVRSEQKPEQSSGPHTSGSGQIGSLRNSIGLRLFNAQSRNETAMAACFRMDRQDLDETIRTILSWAEETEDFLQADEFTSAEEGHIREAKAYRRVLELLSGERNPSCG
jgi:hypothetical protein